MFWRFLMSWHPKGMPPHATPHHIPASLSPPPPSTPSLYPTLIYLQLNAHRSLTSRKNPRPGFFCNWLSRRRRSWWCSVPAAALGRRKSIICFAISGENWLPQTTECNLYVSPCNESPKQVGRFTLHCLNAAGLDFYSAVEWLHAIQYSLGLGHTVCVFERRCAAIASQQKQCQSLRYYFSSTNMNALFVVFRYPKSDRQHDR